MKFKTQKLTDDLNRILDVFAGADGGVDYIKLRVALLAFEEKAMQGDKAAGQILDVVHTFARLIKLTTER